MKLAAFFFIFLLALGCAAPQQPVQKQQVLLTDRMIECVQKLENSGVWGEFCARYPAKCNVEEFCVKAYKDQNF